VFWKETDIRKPPSISALLAGLSPCGLCCEIMADDGHMMRTPELLERAAEWKMPIITIEALQKYLLQKTEKLRF